MNSDKTLSPVGKKKTRLKEIHVKKYHYIIIYSHNNNYYLIEMYILLPKCRPFKDTRNNEYF